LGTLEHISSRLGVFARGILVAACGLAPASGAPAPNLAELEQEAFSAAVTAVADSIVQIRTVGGLEQVDGQSLAQGPTTGLIVRDDGYIVSSAFNFAQEPTSILVRLPSGDQAPAELVGRDSNRMLVLLKVAADEPLPAAKAADVAKVRPGDWAIAVGRTHRAERVNMSVGVVSALGRMHGRVLQTDANTSAANYGGALVDIHGRVLGVIVPMAPEAAGAGETSAVAGADFYDSGIGFAVPLVHVREMLERWIEAGDLDRGVLGVGLKKGSPHSTPPIVTAVWPRSPAAEAGWEPKDRIVAVDGKLVKTQTDLRFHVVPRYAGDELQITIRRGKGAKAEEIETEITLADELPAYRHAFLGVLPERGAAERDEASEDETDEAEADQDEGDEPAGGVAVRAVWPESPAAEAGVEAGDRIIALDGEEVSNIEQAFARLVAKNVGDSIEIKVVRDGDEVELEAELGELPVDVLSTKELASGEADEAAEESVGAATLEELKLPESPQIARYFQPATKSVPAGLLLWLGDGKPETAEALTAAWERTCRRNGLILLLPEPADAAGWTADDLEHLQRILQAAMQRLAVDPRRVVVAGEGKAGQLAYALALSSKGAVSGVAAVDSPLPRTLQLPDNSPNVRLAVLSIETENSPLALLIRKDLEKLAEKGYPATQATRDAEDASDRMLDSSTRSKIARWIDGLDRF
jgi:serine protease Do